MEPRARGQARNHSFMAYAFEVTVPGLVGCEPSRVVRLLEVSWFGGGHLDVERTLGMHRVHVGLLGRDRPAPDSSPPPLILRIALAYRLRNATLRIRDLPPSFASSSSTSRWQLDYGPPYTLGPILSPQSYSHASGGSQGDSMSPTIEN
jgi:hypothetical protein